MSKTIPVHYDGTFSYSIEIQDDFELLPSQLQNLGYQKEQKICIVSDSQVAEIYIDSLKNLLQNSFDQVFSFVFPAGESSKNMDTVQMLYESLINYGFDRHDFLIALGGGVVGDLTGFAASTYLRGIDFIQIPTSLLAQVDSSIGGKTGVDFKQYKNMVGAFYQPKLVYMNLSVLQTLSKRQFSSGIAEILKHGLIKDRTYFDWMVAHSDAIFELEPTALEEMIFRSCNIKREVVENDPKEKGERALLNFGHTIGHAVEKLSDFSLYHGECVAIGCIAASYLSCKMGQITDVDLAMIRKVFTDFNLPVSVKGQDAIEILKTTKSDKKMKAGKINFILLNEIGKAYIYSDLTDDEILLAIQYILDEE
jgi:3-dehydroquinate synthase